jgi:hypothetical protein
LHFASSKSCIEGESTLKPSGRNTFFISLSVDSHAFPDFEKVAGILSRYRSKMGSAIAQIVAENKNGNPRMFGAIREFPFRFTTKLSGKKFSCKVSFENGLLEADFRKNFHSAGVTGGDIMWILSRGERRERATKA